MYSTHQGLDKYKSMSEVLLEISKKKINKQYRQDYDYLKDNFPRYLALEYNGFLIFAFYDTYAKKLVKFNNHNIWTSIDQFKDDWMVDTKKTNMRPWQEYVALLSIEINNENIDKV